MLGKVHMGQAVSIHTVGWSLVEPTNVLVCGKSQSQQTNNIANRWLLMATNREFPNNANVGVQCLLGKEYMGQDVPI